MYIWEQQAHIRLAQAHTYNGNVKRALAHFGRAGHYASRSNAFGSDMDGGECMICLDSGGTPPPIPKGCACRGDAGKAHVACLAKCASITEKKAWWQCQLCLQSFTGPASHQLFEALSEQSSGSRIGSEAWISAKSLESCNLMDRGKYAAAERLLRELIDVSRRKYGDEDAHTLNHMGNLGVCLSHQTNHKDAEQIYRELRRVHARDSGADSPLTLQYTCYLAISIASLGRHEEGVQLLREVVQKNEKLPPKSDLALQDAQELLASALDTFAKADKTNPRAKDARAEALALRRVVHVALKRILGEDHPNTIKTGGDIAVSLKDMGLAAEALPLLRRALDSERRRSGHEHPRALTTAANLAAALADLSELDEAMQILNETVQISSRVLGANHPDTLRYVKWRSNVSETIRRGNRRPQNKFRDLVVSPSDRADAEARAAIAEAELMAMLDLDSDRAADGKKGEKKKKK